jgi:hypothetical protein
MEDKGGKVYYYTPNPNPHPNPNPNLNPNPNPNQVYYYNAQTKVSTYDKPPGFKDPVTGSTK